MANKKNPDEYPKIDKNGTRQTRFPNTKIKVPAEHLGPVVDLIKRVESVRDDLQALVGLDVPEKYRLSWQDHWDAGDVAWSYGYDSDLVIELSETTSYSLIKLKEAGNQYQLLGVHLPPGETALGMCIVLCTKDSFMRMTLDSFEGMDTERPRVLLTPEDDSMYPYLYLCDDCGQLAPGENMDDAKNLLSRLEVGGTYTNKECPECGALAFPLEQMWEEPS